MYYFADEDVFEENKIKKRALFVLCLVFLLFLGSLVSVLYASQNKEAYEVVENQSSYVLTIGSLRGTIYDSDLKKLTNEKKIYAYAVIPDVSSLYEVSNVYGDKYLERFEEGVPFVIYDENFYEFKNEYIDTFVLNERYGDFASHIIGYLNYEKDGVSGIEKAFNSILKEFSGEAKIKYEVNANNVAIAVNEREIINTLEKSTGGVVLTIKKELQEFCEKTAKKYMDTGAVIVTEVNTGKIRAMVSLPFFSQNNIEEALNMENSPFINRALCAYTPGSVFKIITSAAMLSSDADINEKYECIGYEGDYWCYNHKAHGELKGLNEAIAYSCNSYFVNVSKSIEDEILYKTFKDFKLSEEVVLYEEIKSEKGNIPEILYEYEKSQLSFGQGEITLSPLKVSQIVSTVANGGNLVSLKLVEKVVDEKGNVKEEFKDSKKERILSNDDANTIRSAMLLAATQGTAYISENANYGAKTGTAQTGKKEGKSEIVHFWYAGFYPYNNPKYAIVVLSDNTKESDRSPCDEVFSEIINYLKDYQ